MKSVDEQLTLIRRGAEQIAIRHSNRGGAGSRPLERVAGARFWSNGTASARECPTAAASVSLAPMELQILGA